MFELGRMRPWRERFIAWWDGVKHEPGLEYLSADSPSSDGEDHNDLDANDQKSDSIAEKIAVLQQIWGKGFETPGGHEFASELVNSLNLSKNQELLQIGDGLGGTARALAAEFLVSVTALVTSVDKAQIAIAQTAEAGLERRVRFAPFNPGKMGLKARKYHCILIRDVLFEMKDKGRLLDQLEIALVPGGHLLVFDFCLPGPEPTPEVLSAWEQEEAQSPHFVSAADMVELLQKRNFAVLTNEDVTDAYYGLIIDGWLRCVRTVKKMKILGDLDNRFILHLLDEAERWGHRASVLKSGQLRYTRVHAMKSLSGSG